MWEQVALWLLAMYGATVVLWQWTKLCWFRQRKEDSGRRICFIVIAHNAERDIEAVLHDIYGRCLQVKNKTSVYVIDVQSTDLTTSIIDRFSLQFMPVETRSVLTIEGASELAKRIHVADNTMRCIIQLTPGANPDTLVQ